MSESQPQALSRLPDGTLFPLVFLLSVLHLHVVSVLNGEESKVEDQVGKLLVQGELVRLVQGLLQLEGVFALFDLKLSC